VENTSINYDATPPDTTTTSVFPRKKVTYTNFAGLQQMEIDFPDKGRAFPRYLFECIINFYNDNKTKYVWALLWEQEQANIRTDFDKYEIPQDVSDYVLSLKTNKEQGTYIGDGYDDLSRFLIAYHATGNSQAGEVPDEVRYSFFKSTRGFDYSSLAKFLLDKIAPDVFYKK